MCIGYFSEIQEAPIVTVGVILPDLDKAIARPFLFDTGSNFTTVMRATAVDGDFHPDDLQDDSSVNDTTTRGATGEGDSYWLEQPVWLGFDEEVPDEDRWNLHIELLNGIVVSEDAPFNLLGRDVIHRFFTDYNPHDGTITMNRNLNAEGDYTVIETESQTWPHFDYFPENEE